MPLDAVPWDAIGPSGVAALMFIGLFYAIMSGRLVPRRTMEDAIHQLNEWRTEARLKDQTIQELTDQNRELLEVGRTVREVLHAISRDRPDEVNR